MLTVKHLVLAATLLCGLTAAETDVPATTSLSTIAPGGWYSATLTADDKARIKTVLSDDSKYPTGDSLRLCITDVLPTFDQRVASGTYDKFRITGCKVTSAAKDGGECSVEVVATCSPKWYDLTVLRRPWEDILRAEEITYINDAPALIGTVAPDPEPVVSTTIPPGGYQSIPVTSREIDLLTQTLGDEANYPTSEKSRICFKSINALEQAVVAGMKYRYHIEGCAVNDAKTGGGKCHSDATCSSTLYDVEVLVSSPTAPAKVLSVVAKGNPTPTPPPACLESEVEPPASRWLRAVE